MFETVVNLVKASRPIQFVPVFVAGGTVAALFYPTKTIQEKLEKTYQSQISTLNQQHQQELQKTQSDYQQQLQQVTTTNQQLTAKVTSLTTQVTNLKSSKKTNYYKIVHPDGTVEVRASSDNETDESQQISQQIQQEYKSQLQTQVTKLESIQAQQISTLQKEWDSKEQTYQSQIATLTQSKTVSINPKNFNIAAGLMTNGDYYGDVGYSIWGPFTINALAEFGHTTNAGGLGLGLKF